MKSALEQPSPRGELGDSLGRRNIVLLKSSELNANSENERKIAADKHVRKPRKNF